MKLLSHLSGKGTSLLFLGTLCVLLNGCYNADNEKKEYKNTLAAYSNNTASVDPIANLRIYQIMVDGKHY